MKRFFSMISVLAVLTLIASCIGSSDEVSEEQNDGDACSEDDCDTFTEPDADNNDEDAGDDAEDTGNDADDTGNDADDAGDDDGDIDTSDGGSMDGYWETTYDCPEAIIDFEPGPLCNGMYVRSASSVDGHYTEITADANNPAGGGGRGHRHWMGSGTNVHSGGLRVVWDTAESRFFVRFYIRYSPTFSWSPYLNYDKLLYINDGGSDAVVVGMADTAVTVWIAETDTTVASSGGGWDTFGDGTWHALEVELDGATRIVRIWVDGELRGEGADVDFGSGTPSWDSFSIGHNNAYPDHTDYCDFDDIAVAFSSYGGFVTDASGNSMIGPLGF